MTRFSHQHRKCSMLPTECDENQWSPCQTSDWARQFYQSFGYEISWSWLWCDSVLQACSLLEDGLQQDFCLHPNLSRVPWRKERIGVNLMQSPALPGQRVGDDWATFLEKKECHDKAKMSDGITTVSIWCGSCFRKRGKEVIPCSAKTFKYDLGKSQQDVLHSALWSWETL